MEGVDLFSGIGGIALALKGVVKTSLYCEVDPFCQQVLAERMEAGALERAPIHANIRTLHLPETARPQFICGGFPCQDISCIGLQRGIVDSDRSSLFFEIMRLVDECPSIQYVFLENVANITKCGLKEVVAELTKRGFNMQWMMKSAGAMGAPHARNRWFCLAARGQDHDMLRDLLAHQAPEVAGAPSWDAEPCPRITFKPAVRPDPSFDECWTLRCQTLGNTVVPAAVREAFLTLANGCVNWSSIHQGLKDYAVPCDQLPYPLPDAGLIYAGGYLPLPKAQSDRKHSVKITVVHRGDAQTLGNFPTPRRGMTHPSSLTDRGLRDLPTILVHSQEARGYVQSKGVTPQDDMHALVLPNVNYIEWLMGYPADWTKSVKYTKQPSRSRARAAADPATSEEEDQELSQPRTKGRRTRHKPVAADSADDNRPKRYNGMHVLMREMQGKDIKEVAAAWRALAPEQRHEYSKKATEMSWAPS